VCDRKVPDPKEADSRVQIENQQNEQHMNSQRSSIVQPPTDRNNGEPANEQQIMESDNKLLVMESGAKQHCMDRSPNERKDNKRKRRSKDKKRRNNDSTSEDSNSYSEQSEDEKVHPKKAFGIFTNKISSEEWKAAEQQKIKEKKNQYQRHWVSVVGQHNRINRVRKKKHQSRTKDATKTKKPVPRAKDQPNIKRKLDEISKKYVQPVWKFYGKEHGERAARRKGDLREDEEIQAMKIINDVNIGDDERVLFVTDLRLCGNDNVICVSGDDKENFEKGEVDKGFVVRNVVCDNPKVDKLGYDSGEDFIG
jgi:hypothetical protein